MSAQTLKYNLPKKDYLDIYKCLGEKHLNNIRFDLGDDINILDFVEILLSERIQCEETNLTKNKYL